MSKYFVNGGRTVMRCSWPDMFITLRIWVYFIWSCLLTSKPAKWTSTGVTSNISFRCNLAKISWSLSMKNRFLVCQKLRLIILVFSKWFGTSCFSVVATNESESLSLVSFRFVWVIGGIILFELSWFASLLAIFS